MNRPLETDMHPTVNESTTLISQKDFFGNVKVEISPARCKVHVRGRNCQRVNSRNSYYFRHVAGQKRERSD